MDQTGHHFSGIFESSEMKMKPPDEKNLVKRAINSGKKHGIELCPGRQNRGRGDCAFESVLFNINDRICFTEHLPFSTDYYRRIWMTDMQNYSLNDPTWNCSYSQEELLAGWEEMKESGVYERGLFGDLMLPGISRGVHKRILIFITHEDSPHDPIYVVDPNCFGGYTDSDIPVVLAYNLTHYESIHPVSDLDITKTIDLAKTYLTGLYNYKRSDIPFLISSVQDFHLIQGEVQVVLISLNLNPETIPLLFPWTNLAL